MTGTDALDLRSGASPEGKECASDPPDNLAGPAIDDLTVHLHIGAGISPEWRELLRSTNALSYRFPLAMPVLNDWVIAQTHLVFGAGQAEYDAVVERWRTAQSISYTVIVMELPYAELLATFLAMAAGSLCSLALHGFGKLFAGH